MRSTGPTGTEAPVKESGENPPARQFVLFSAYRVDPAWRRLPELERNRGREEMIAVLEDRMDGRILTHAYSTVGLRADAEIVLWRIGYELETLQEMTARLLATGLGAYLTATHSFLGQAKRSIYVDKLNPEHEESRMYIKPARSKYIFIYPFVKTREWFQLSKHARQGIMDEHIEIGNRFKSVRLNTVYSFGMDDQEWIVAFETDYPSDFVDLVMALRESEGSRYTLRDTPILTGIRRSFREAIELMG